MSLNTQQQQKRCSVECHIRCHVRCHFICRLECHVRCYITYQMNTQKNTQQVSCLMSYQMPCQVSFHMTPKMAYDINFQNKCNKMTRNLLNPPKKPDVLLNVISYDIQMTRCHIICPVRCQDRQPVRCCVRFYGIEHPPKKQTSCRISYQMPCQVSFRMSSWMSCQILYHISCRKSCQMSYVLLMAIGIP